jgi:hypothetical protein
VKQNITVAPPMQPRQELAALSAPTSSRARHSDLVQASAMQPQGKMSKKAQKNDDKDVSDKGEDVGDMDEDVRDKDEDVRDKDEAGVSDVEMQQRMHRYFPYIYLLLIHPFLQKLLKLPPHLSSKLSNMSCPLSHLLALALHRLHVSPLPKPLLLL